MKVFLKNPNKMLEGVKKPKWIIIIISISAIIILSLAACYYFFIYLRPNFNDFSQNYISTNTANPIKPGEEISYSINFKNTGNKTVDELEIKVSLPSNTTIAFSDGKTITGDNGNTLIFNFDRIEKNQSGKADFTVKVDKPLDNGTYIILDDAIFNYTVGSKQHNQKITSDLSHIIKSSPDFSNFNVKAVDENGAYLQMGDTIEYTIMVKNSGDMNATGVEIKSTLSENVTVIEESINNSGNYKNNAVVWNINNFDINKTYTFKFKATVNYGLNDGDLLENKNTLTCDQGIKAEKSTSDSVKLIPEFSDSEVLLSDDNGGYLWAGEIIDIKIIIRNSGEKEADSYRLICSTPEGATYISESGTSEGISWSDEIRGLIWDLKNLDVDQQKEINFKIRVNNNLFYTGGNIATNFKIESGGLETELEQKVISVKKHIYMTIVAMGDSLIAKSDWVQRFDQLLESAYPYADYNTIASGVNGERAYEGYARFNSTVAIYKPQIIIIAYGTNDTGGGLSNFSVHLEGLVIKSRNLGATVFLNLIGPVFYPGKESYPLYNNEILKIAAKYSLPVIDVLSPLSQDTNLYLYDGTHYTPEGSAIVALAAFNNVTRYLDDFGQRK